MEYKGKLYGKVANKYFDLEVTADDYDKLKEQLEIEQAQNSMLIDECERLKKELAQFQQTRGEEKYANIKDSFKALADAFGEENIKKLSKEVLEEAPSPVSLPSDEKRCKNCNGYIYPTSDYCAECLIHAVNPTA